MRVATDLVHRMSKEVEIDVAKNAMKFRSVGSPATCHAGNCCTSHLHDHLAGPWSAHEHGPGLARRMW